MHRRGTAQTARKNTAVLKAFWAAVLVMIVAVTSWWLARRERAAPVTAAEVRSCEAWGQTYAIIPWNEFPRDTLRVGPGEEWLIRLHPADTSGWIIVDPRARDGWTSPTDTVHMLFSDGLRITDAPGKKVEFGRRNAFRAWGEGCLLVQASGS